MKRTIVALLIGIAIGTIGSHICMRHFPRPTDPDLRFKYIVRQFNRRLKLDDDQKKQVETILLEKRKKMESIRADAKPRLEQIRQETRQEISKILRPDQLKKFEIL